MNGKWITDPAYDGGVNFYFEVRKEFTLFPVPETVMINITADTRYRLFADGVFVASGPVRNSDSIQYYDRLAVHFNPRTEKHEIRIEVYSCGKQNFTFHSVCAAVKAEFEGIFATGPDWDSRVLNSWRRKVDHFTTQLGFMEWRDDLLPESEWRKAVTPENPPRKELRENRLPPLAEQIFLPADISAPLTADGTGCDDPFHLGRFLQDEPALPLPPDRIEAPASLMTPDGHCVIRPGSGVRLLFDFSHEVSGAFELELDAPAGTTADVTYGEEIVKDRICSAFERATYHFTDHYRLKAGHSRIGTKFVDRGFRIVQVVLRNFQSPVTIRSVHGIDRRRPEPLRAAFHSSDELLNRIWEVCVETISACASDTFTDCPWRERGFWVNDLLVNNLVNLTCFGGREIHPHCYELAFSQVCGNGMIPAICPQPKREKDPYMLVFPATNLFMMLVLDDYRLYTGDDATVKKYLPDMERILDSLWRMADDDGILLTDPDVPMWHFYDWSFELNNLSLFAQKESMLSSLFIIAAKTFARTAAGLAYAFDAAEQERRWKKTAAGLKKVFFDPAKKRLVDQAFDGVKNQTVTVMTQLAHALWLLTGEVPAADRDAVIAALTDPDCLIPEYYLHYFWFKAARIAGLEAESLRRIRHYWGRCMAAGSPTLYEAGIHKFGKEAMHGTGSLCHAFGTIPLNVLQSMVLGVEPLEPGFRLFRFDPNRFDLKFASGRIPAPSGNIRVKINETETVIEIPAGCTGILPNGRKLEPGTHRLRLTDVGNRADTAMRLQKVI
ncbi:MAG: hypothetical protein E7055_16725 [Lentisphaerae bacterium]|nr:hypothetical protein [Lentisphaerota bacterium]